MEKFISFKIRRKSDKEQSFQYHRSMISVYNELKESGLYEIIPIKKGKFKKVILDVSKASKPAVKAKPRLIKNIRKTRPFSNRKLRNFEVKGKVVNFINELGEVKQVYHIHTQTQESMLQARALRNGLTFRYAGEIIINIKKPQDAPKVIPIETKNKYIKNPSNSVNMLSIQYYDGQTIHFKVNKFERVGEIIQQRNNFIQGTQQRTIVAATWNNTNVL